MGCGVSTASEPEGRVHPPPQQHHTQPQQQKPYPQHYQPYPPQQQPYQQPLQQQPYQNPQQQQPSNHPQQPPPPYSEHPPQSLPPGQSQPPPQKQPQSPPAQSPSEKSQPAVNPTTQPEEKAVEFNETLVTTLIELEQSISQLEKRNVFKQHKMKYEQLVSLTAMVGKLTEQQLQLQAQTQKEYQDVIDLQNNSSVKVMMSHIQFDQQMTKEQQEYMDALNKQEMHKKQVMAATHQEASLKAEVHMLHTATEELKALYDKQDGLLSSVFDGKYGSALEYQLETVLDHLLEQKQRIAVAKYKWTNSKILIQHASGQFGFAVKRWNDVLKIPPTNASMRYQFAAEARNNILAGLQNVGGAQRYLSTIKFPYCNADEIKTVNTALQYIFTDLHTPERHKYALDCYVTMYRRSAALVQWFDRIINKTIMVDLEKATKECSAKQRELKLERMKLIREKIREKSGDDVADKLQVTEGSEEEGEAEEQELVALVEADNVSQTGESIEVPQSEDRAGPTPLPSEELAATPSTMDIFGNIEELKKQHEELMKQFNDQQELSRARANEDLQAKLAQRKTRRNRMALQEAEMESLGNS